VQCREAGSNPGPLGTSEDEFTIAPDPFLKKLPNSNSELIRYKKMIGRFRDLVAKRAKLTIRPPMFFQSIGDPKPILESNPSIIFDLRRNPSLPNNSIHVVVDKAKKLKFVSRCRDVLTILHELPNNSIPNNSQNGHC
jgi:hypothetical protein